jgi:hypothetical protein
MTGYQMPDGSYLFAQDAAAQAAMAWALEALNEFKEVNQRLKRIEKRLEFMSLADSG